MDSNQTDSFVPTNSDAPTVVSVLSLIARKELLEENILSIQGEIQNATGMLENLIEQLQAVKKQLASSKTDPPEADLLPKPINFTSATFSWRQELLSKLNRVFGITQFRGGQEGVCNANLAGRDVVCIMPTGAGKSLTYQLPAVVSKGCTLVISPLISLIADQMLHLRAIGVEACSLTGSLSDTEKDAISRRLCAPYGTNRDVKLCYVTPEKLVKSEQFKHTLLRMQSAGTLDRIVLDEAHCVSQLGHDFRPDYGRLGILRDLFPKVPILMLSATLPPGVLEDVIGAMRLRPLTPGHAATPEGTVLFSAPLHRQNLRYRVVSKSSAAATIKAMVDYITTHQARACGIVYCSSKDDVEKTAAALTAESGGIIRTGVYHSDVLAEDKMKVHHKWRDGEIDVVVATIAFGMGIDKDNVRFVLHHTIPKSLEAFYQESGRAGRDGRDADCILYYRHQDAMRIFGLVRKEGHKKTVHDERGKFHAMLKFATERHECRKITFAEYFRPPAELSREDWDHDVSTPCGRCDNCIRPPVTVARHDVSVDAWRICKVAEEMLRQGGRITLTALVDVSRGNKRGTFAVFKNGGKHAAKGQLNLEILCGGKVCLGRDDTESLVVKLILSGHLVEDCHESSYHDGYDVYLKPGPLSASLTRHCLDSVDAGNAPQFDMTLLIAKPSQATRSKQKCKKDTGSASKASFDPSSDEDSLGAGESSAGNLWEVDYDSDGGVDVDFSTDGDVNFSTDEPSEMGGADEDRRDSDRTKETGVGIVSDAEDSSGYSYYSDSDSEWEPSNTRKRPRTWAVSIHRASSSREGSQARASTSSDEEYVAIKRRRIGRATAESIGPQGGEQVMSSE